MQFIHIAYFLMNRFVKISDLKARCNVLHHLNNKLIFYLENK